MIIFFSKLLTDQFIIESIFNFYSGFFNNNNNFLETSNLLIRKYFFKDKIFWIDFTEMCKNQPSLFFLIINFPLEIISCFNKILNNIILIKLKNFISRKSFFKVNFFNFSQIYNNLGQCLNLKYVNKLIIIKGSVLNVFQPYLKIKKAFYICKLCDSKFYLNHDKDKLLKPTICKNCKKFSQFELILEKSKYQKFQKILLNLNESKIFNQIEKINLLIKDELFYPIKNNIKILVLGILRLNFKTIKKDFCLSTSCDYYVEVINYKELTQYKCSLTNYYGFGLIDNNHFSKNKIDEIIYFSLLQNKYHPKVFKNAILIKNKDVKIKHVFNLYISWMNILFYNIQNYESRIIFHLVLYFNFFLNFKILFNLNVDSDIDSLRRYNCLTKNIKNLDYFKDLNENSYLKCNSISKKYNKELYMENTRVLDVSHFRKQIFLDKIKNYQAFKNVGYFGLGNLTMIKDHSCNMRGKCVQLNFYSFVNLIFYNLIFKNMFNKLDIVSDILYNHFMLFMTLTIIISFIKYNKLISNKDVNRSIIYTLEKSPQ
ncbi:hypothetical protein (nucleomorph) [Guillardia theta]|uniref:DNA helicase n=1 Tax=Guillardia theta TaxID=55529 RepID=Q98RW1_GUITH|nr:hypothetical protein GTHECHR1047 [Guillardia theta]AAK39839.1 hypothetical protein [Guillardia theta]